MAFLVSVSTLLVWALVCEVQHHNYVHGFYAPATVGKDGRVIDTPEVSQAKAAHLAAFKLASRPTHYHGASNYRATAAIAPLPVYGLHNLYSNPSYFRSRVQHGPYGYRGPPAPLAHDGRVMDTPEVAQAKAAHLAAFSQAASRGYDDYGNQYPSSLYRGDYSEEDADGSSSASIEARASSQNQSSPASLAQDGRVVGTFDVAQVKAAHLTALNRAFQGHRVPYYADY